MDCIILSRRKILQVSVVYARTMKFIYNIIRDKKFRIINKRNVCFL